MLKVNLKDNKEIIDLEKELFQIIQSDFIPLINNYILALENYNNECDEIFYNTVKFSKDYFDQDGMLCLNYFNVMYKEIQVIKFKINHLIDNSDNNYNKELFIIITKWRETIRKIGELINEKYSNFFYLLSIKINKEKESFFIEKEQEEIKEIENKLLIN